MKTTLMGEFNIIPLLAGLCISVLTGPLGCFVVWQRMAFFGETLAHAALLGLALGIIFSVSPTIAVLTMGLFITAALVQIQKRPSFSNDTLLGIFSHGALAAGLVIISLADISVDLDAWLFGDLSTVSRSDVWVIIGFEIPILIFLATQWDKLLSLTINEELARADQIPVDRLKLLLMCSIAIAIAVSIQIVGILLIASLLVMPAAAARNIARDPAQMAILAILVGGLSVIGGIFSSWQWAVPAGPAIVLCAVIFFAALFPFKRYTL